MAEDLPVVVLEMDDAESAVIEVMARCTNVPVGRGAFEAAVKLRPRSRILLKDGARVIERYDGKGPPRPSLRIVEP